MWVMEDVKGGFSNVLGQQVLDLCKKGRCRWLKWFFRPRQFKVEWDEKVRGSGSANVGVPQGSQLSPVVLLIWMASILEKLENMKEEVGEGVGVVGVGIPAFIDDMCADVIVWEGGNMQRVEVNVKRIVRKGSGGMPPADRDRQRKKSCTSEKPGKRRMRIGSISSNWGSFSTIL